MNGTQPTPDHSETIRVPRKRSEPFEPFAPTFSPDADGFIRNWLIWAPSLIP